MTQPDHPLQSLHDMRTQEVWKGRANTRRAILVCSIIVIAVMIVLIIVEPIFTAPAPMPPSIIETGARAAFDVAPAPPPAQQRTSPVLP